MRRDGAAVPRTKESAYFLSINRNKKSVALDLERPEGRQVFLDLCRVSDVVWENFRPGVMARLGCAPEALRALNPRLIVCSISAFGQEGPYRNWPAFDLALQAMGGGMSITGEDGPTPGADGPADGGPGGRHVRGAGRRRRAVPPRADRRGRPLRPLAPRLPGLAADLRRPVLLGRRPGSRPRRLGPRLGRALPGLRDARRLPGRRRLLRQVLVGLLPGDRAPRADRRPALRFEPEAGANARGADPAAGGDPARAADRRVARPAPAGGRAGGADHSGGPGA